MDTVRPRGRDQVMEALLQSARRLIAERGPSVALRDIAEDADVNFGLIYQYLGTKEQVVREVYDRAAQSAADRLTEVTHIDEALALLMTLGDGSTARLLGWAILEGNPPAGTFMNSPALEVLTKIVEADSSRSTVRLSEEEARVFSALAMVIAVGWRLFGGTALAAAGLGSTEPTEYDELVTTYLMRFAAAVTGRKATPPDQGRNRSRRRSES